MVGVRYALAPLCPRTDVFEPILTTVSPVIVPAQENVPYYQKQIAFERKKKGREFSDVPEMMTIFLESPDTAEVSASRVVTVVVEPPTPPVVLHGSGAKGYEKNERQSEVRLRCMYVKTQRRLTLR